MTTDRDEEPDSALYFDGSNDNFTFDVQQQLTANFSFSFWAKPEQSTVMGTEATSGTQMFNGSPHNALLYAAHGGSPRAGFGITLGTNGFNVTHYGSALAPASLAYATPLSEWNHFIVLSTNNRASFYLNGLFVKQGLQFPEPLFTGAGMMVVASDTWNSDVNCGFH